MAEVMAPSEASIDTGISSQKRIAWQIHLPSSPAAPLQGRDSTNVDHPRHISMAYSCSNQSLKQNFFSGDRKAIQGWFRVRRLSQGRREMLSVTSVRALRLSCSAPPMRHPCAIPVMKRYTYLPTLQLVFQYSIVV